MTPVSRDEAVETVRQRLDIVELVGAYVKLKKVGSNFVGLCPFHNEKSPSFTVSPRKGFFHCFGCNASGDVFSFLMKMEGKGFGEVLTDLAARAGVELPERSPGELRARELTSRLLSTNEAAAAFYEQLLWDRDRGTRGREVLADRRVGADVARLFRVGYAAAGWNNLSDHLPKVGASIEDALAVGLLVQGNRGPYDTFRDRLVFPILGLDGKVHGFGARRIDPNDTGPKYINSRQSPVFDKSEILFGLLQARASIQSAGMAVVVEGYFDVLSPVGAGVEGLVATCGTALSTGHARLLHRMSERVTTIYDADAAGVKGSFRAAEVLLAEGLAPYMVSLPAGEDPDSFVRKQGGQALQELLSRSEPVLQVLADTVLKEAGGDVEARAGALRGLVPLLAACRDNLKLGGYLQLLSGRFGVNESHLRDAVREHRRSNVVAEPRRAPPPRDASVTPVNPDEETALTLLLRFPNLSARVIDSRLVECITSEILRTLLVQMLRAGASPSPGALLARIEDADLKARLSVKLIDDAAFPEDKAGELMDGCIRKIRAAKLRQEEQLLREQIQAAELAGHEEEARELKAKKYRLARERNALGAVIKISS